MVVTHCATGSSNQIQGLFCRELPRSQVPYRSTIIRNVDKYSEYGVSTNGQKDASGRRRTRGGVLNFGLGRGVPLGILKCHHPSPIHVPILKEK